MVRKLGLIAASIFFILAGTVARADVTAKFSDPNRRGNLIVEVADSGEMRFTDPRGDYFLFVDGHAYQVQAGPGGPTVVTSEALGFQAREEIRTGRVIYSSADDSKTPKVIRYIPEKPVSISGYQGTQYVVSGSTEAAYVLTDQLRLLPIGRALATYLRVVTEISAEPRDDLGNLFDLLATHGVLELWGQKLSSASFAPIDRSRFAIPATPLTLDDVKRIIAIEDHSATPDRPVRSPIVRAVFQGRQLLTLASDGRIEAWTDGGSTAHRFDTPGKVLDLCRRGDELFLVTQESQKTDTLIWSGTVGAWTLRLTLKNAADDRFLALDCSGNEPIALTANAIRMLKTNVSVRIRPDPVIGRAYLTTLQYGSYLYVGANAGEWGGGLRRFSLKDGTSNAIAGSDPKNLCGGLLNMACGPVTGIATDPSDPDCVLVATGLVHMMSSGSIVRVCGDKLSLAYAKPYTIDLGWQFDPKSPPQAGSVPFFSMGKGSGKVWAVGSDGLYTFSNELLPMFKAFPRPFRLPASGIDWTNSDFILISTMMNQVHSLSGSSIILVPR